MVSIDNLLYPLARIPSLGSATANETFFSSLMPSRRVERRGVTFPSTRAAVCSRAATVSTAKWSATALVLLTSSRTIEFMEVLQFQAIGREKRVSPEGQSVRISGWALQRKPLEAVEYLHVQTADAFCCFIFPRNFIVFENLGALCLEKSIPHRGFSATLLATAGKLGI